MKVGHFARTSEPHVSHVSFVIVACVAGRNVQVISRQEAEVVLRFVGFQGIEIRVVWRGYCFGVAPSHCHCSAVRMSAKSVLHEVNVEVSSAVTKQIVLSLTVSHNSHIRSFSKVADVLQGPGATGRRKWFPI